MIDIREFEVQISCPRPPRPKNLQADHHENLVQRAVATPGAINPCVREAAVTSETVSLVCRVRARSAGLAVEQATSALYYFLLLAHFRLPDHQCGQPYPVPGPVHVLLQEETTVSEEVAR